MIYDGIEIAEPTRGQETFKELHLYCALLDDVIHIARQDNKMTFCFIPINKGDLMVFKQKIWDIECNFCKARFLILNGTKRWLQEGRIRISPDVGCKIHPSCLNCPEDDCIL